ncbi:MAG TPA: tripartite tricarboxylate transporter substrate binding protein [Xanthobacteraceae bacterium]|jgi:tripartite-type tricarboxylate transporter receptor subunit TctC|nr:tripartite tricarboxylate transporter substrate binding protein [Xanthobacteraceae bacterium]
MKLRRRKFLHLTATAVTLRLASRYAWAQAYPTRPVRIIVGFPAGIAPDIVARVVGQALSDRLGQQFVVENRPGAGSNIGTEIVVRAPPDGYTLLLAVSSGAINATLYSNLSFSYVHDLAPVGMIGLGPFVMVVNPKLPTKNVPEFIAYAKANPGKINMASQGTGLASHLMGELFKMMAGVNLVHVPYAGNFTADLLSGQVQVAFVPITNVIEYMRDARLRPLAVTTATRVEFLPDVPAMSEFLPGYDATGWNGIGAPRGTPSAIIDKLNNEINAIVRDPAMKERLFSLGVEPLSMTPAEFGKRIADDTEKWAKVIKFANIKAE